MSHATRNRLRARAHAETAQRSAPRIEMALLLVVSGLAALLAAPSQATLGGVLEELTGE